MKSDEVHGIRKNGKSKICAHQRMVDDHCDEQGLKTGHLVCRECGEIIPESIHGSVKAENI